MTDKKKTIIYLTNSIKTLGQEFELVLRKVSCFEKDIFFSSIIVSNNGLCGIQSRQLFFYCPIGKRDSLSAG